jgi:hypothetical protein
MASQDSTSVIVLNAEARTPLGLTHRLKSLFGQQGWYAVSYHDPYLAMAELCLRERAQASRAAWGLQRAEHMALVIVDPHRWPGVDGLVAAIKRYTPSASVWSYREGELRSIAAPPPVQTSQSDHAMTVLDVDDADLEPPPPAITTMPAPQLRLAGTPAGTDLNPSATAARGDQRDPPVDSHEHNDQDRGQLHDQSSAKPDPATVTREEIDLLLQRDPYEGNSRGGVSA